VPSGEFSSADPSAGRQSAILRPDIMFRNPMHARENRFNHGAE